MGYAAKWDTTLAVSGTKWDVTNIITYFGLYGIWDLIINKLTIKYKKLTGTKWENCPLSMWVVWNGKISHFGYYWYKMGSNC